MTAVLAAQLGLPLALLAVLASAGGGRPVRIALIVLLLGYLAVIARLGLWTYLPPWTPAALALGSLTAFAFGRGSTVPAARGRAARAGLVGACLILLAITGWGAAEAIATRRMPAVEPIHLAFPLEPGRYLVVNGGARLSTNAHLRTLDAAVPRFRAWRGQSFGVDIVALDRYGRRADGWRPADPARYVIWNRRVIAPCAGRVLATRDDAPDMPPPRPDRSRMTGNHVLLDCGGPHVLLAHLRRGGVVVATGERVQQGQLLGYVGNSGNSDEPHLHLHAQDPGPPDSRFDARPRPVLIDDRYLVRNDRVDTMH